VRRNESRFELARAASFHVGPRFTEPVSLNRRPVFESEARFATSDFAAKVSYLSIGLTCGKEYRFCCWSE